ncbi:protein PXR1-like [Hippoglossus stenolepis]|uniref:protein PXR1-like n=1 Tax=Hippoglossus stenolepis TaxID=195615 RepID=UPI00159C8476|nr:protein PXR1-like [Hippoglossus stenolepis]
MKNISWGEERKKVAEKLESSASLLLKSKDDLTSLIQLVESEKAKEKELEKELRNMNMRFKLKEVEVVSLNADLKLQEDKLQRYILENEGRPEEIEELHKKMRDLDERWSTEHKESLEKEIKLEDDIKLPIQQNIVLQEQALKTDSYKERVKKEKEEKKERKKSGKEEKMEKREKEEIEGTTRRRLPCFLFNFKPS